MSCNKMTFSVTLNDQFRIIDTPPIVRIFKGQHIDNLRTWMRKFGGYREQVLNNE